MAEPARRRDVKRAASRSQARAAGGAAPKVSTPRTLTTRWAAIILAVLTLAFFHDVMLGGKSFVAPDTLAPAGFVRMGEKALYGEHTYPLWNPYVFLGMPSFASGTYNPLIYPPDWPLALVQKVVPLPDMTWLVLYYFLGGFFFFLLAREWGARAPGALLGAVAFVFAPNLVAVGTHGHGSQLVDSMILPLMLWLAARWMRRGGLHDLAWLAIAGGFQLLRGHVQICFYTWLAVALYVVVEWIAGLRRKEAPAAITARAAAVALAAVLAFGISAFYSLPLREYAKHSIRGGSDVRGGVGMDYATGWSLGPKELPEIVVPGWMGFGGATYWGPMPFTDYPNPYIGLVAVVLLVPAFLANGAPRVFALVMAVLALLIAFGNHTPFYGFLYAHLPLFNKFRIPVMILLLFQLASALGVAWGWSALIAAPPATVAGTRRRGPLDRVVLATGAVIALALLIGLLGQSAWHTAYVKAALAAKTAISMGSQGVNAFGPDNAQAAWQEFWGSFIRACLLGIVASGVAWLARSGRAATAATALALGLIAIELMPVSGRVMGTAIGDPPPRNLEIGRDDVTDFLQKQGDAGTFRILPLDEFQSNRFAGFGIASVGGYNAAKTRLYQDYFDKDRQGLIAQVNWLRLLNVRYIVSQAPYQQYPPYLKQVFSGQGGVVVENLIALPRATVVGAYRVIPAAAIFDSVSAGQHDSATMTWLESDPHLTLGPVNGATAHITSYRVNDVTVDVTTPGPGLLRLADLWYPDWTATVDGKETPVLQADYLLRAVAVPAGHHVVVFRFRSATVRLGMTLSLVSLALALAMLAASYLRRRTPPAPPPAAAPAGTA